MTDIVNLTNRLYDRIEWQSVPDYVTLNSLSVYIADAIRYLYVVTGRAPQFIEDMFAKDEEGVYNTFSATLLLDEEEYVL